VVRSGHLSTFSAAALSIVLGICLAFEIPARIPIVCSVVDEETIPNALAINNLVFSTGITIGRALAAVALAWGFVVECFVLNAASYVIELVSIAMLHGPFRANKQKRSTTFADLVDGLRYFFGNRLSRRVLIATAMFGFFGMQFQPLAAGFAAGISNDTGIA